MTKLNAVANVQVTDWQSYTPTGAITTSVTYSGRWRRIGDTLQGQVTLFFSGTNTQGAVTFTDAQILNGLGLTVDTAKLTVTGALSSLGTWSAIDSGVSSSFTGVIGRNFSTGEWQLNYSTGITSSSRVDTGVSIPFSFTVNDAITLSFQIPIANWSSNLVTGERAVEEYAFNTGTVTAAGGSDTTSFGYGPSGTPILAYNSATLNSVTSFTVQFQSSIQPTDVILLEASSNGGGRWAPIGAAAGGVISPITYQTSAIFGAGVVVTSSNQVTVEFGNSGRVTNPSGGYGTASGSTWGSLVNWRWRVRKVSGGATVGYPISTSNVLGRTDGVAPAAGYIGQTIESAVVESASAGSSGFTLGTLNLTPGVWAVTFVGAIIDSTQPVTGVNWSIQLTSNVALNPNTVAYYNPVVDCIGGNGITPSGGAVRGYASTTSIVNISTATPYYLRGAWSVAGGGTIGIKGYAKAVRIA